jgi:hypothetical protein
MGARKKDYPPFLSQYLLQKAAPFMMYPHRAYSLTAKERGLADNVTRKLMEWRKTFQPKPADPDLDMFSEETMLDQVYSRDLLAAVPDFVKRTQSLRQITLAGMRKSEPVAYLREAANCFIHGLFQACVALARSAMELQLRARVSELVGQQAAVASELKELIDRHGPRLLSKQSLSDANAVRRAGNEVLHVAATDTAKALAVLEAARRVILQLSPAG